MWSEQDFLDTLTPGSHEIRVTPRMIEESKRLAGLGMKQKDMAAYFGIGYTTFRSKITKNDALRVAVRQGKASMVSEVAGELIQQIRDGNTTATIFYLKTQAGWCEPDDIVKDDEDEDDKAPPENLELNTKDPIEAAKAYQQLMLRGK